MQAGRLRYMCNLTDLLYLCTLSHVGPCFLRGWTPLAPACARCKGEVRFDDWIPGGGPFTATNYTITIDLIILFFAVCASQH